MTRQGRKAGSTRWLLIATVAGILVVVVMALLFFSGYIVPAEPTPVLPSPAKTVGSTPTPTIATGTTTQSGTTRPVPSLVFTETTAVPVSSEGVYLSVDYIGAFSGTYSVNGVEQTVRSSGTRLYALPVATGTVSATFQKDDGTTKHALIVGIYKDGKLLQSGEISTAYGKVSVTADV